MDLVRNSDCFDSLRENTTKSRKFLLDVLLWADGAKPRVSVQVKLIDVPCDFFHAGHSKPHELHGFVGNEYLLPKVYIARFFINGAC